MDPDFETTVNELAEAVVEEEKSNFQPGLVSFEVHAERIRQQFKEGLYDFVHKFRNGYEVIGNWLEEHGFDRPAIQEEKLSIFDDEEQFTQALDEGKNIYELVGYSPEMMTNMYRAAYQLAQEKEYEKGRDAFYYLATLSPDDYDFWLGLAICCTQLKEHDAALEASLRAIDVDPTKAIGYMNAVHLYVQANNRDPARELCNSGLQLASENSQEPWSQELTSALNQAKRFIG